MELEVEQDMEIKAVFEVEEYSIKIDYNEEKGHINIEPDREHLEKGERVYLTSEAAPGFEFYRWSGDVTGDDPELSVVVDDDMEIKAEFMPIEYEISVEIFGDGEVRFEPEKEYYYYDEEVWLQAEPRAGWEFLRWSGDVESENKEMMIKIEDDIKIEALFRFKK